MNKPDIRPAFIQPEDLLDRLYKAWITDKVEQLPKQEQLILDRMEYADAKLREGGTCSIYRNLVNDMMQYFKAHEVTKRTIENDINRAKRFFLSARPREEKEYARGMSIEWYKRLIWKAESAEDFRASAKLMEGLDKIQGFLKDDPNLPDYQKVHRQPILVTGDATQLGIPEIENKEEVLAKLRGSKKDYLSELEAEDIDFEEETEDDGL